MTTAASAATETAVPARKAGFRHLLRNLLRDPWATGSSVVIAIFLLAAIFADLITISCLTAWPEIVTFILDAAA